MSNKNVDRNEGKDIGRHLGIPPPLMLPPQMQHPPLPSGYGFGPGMPNFNQPPPQPQTIPMSSTSTGNTSLVNENTRGYSHPPPHNFPPGQAISSGYSHPPNSHLQNVSIDGNPSHTNRNRFERTIPTGFSHPPPFANPQRFSHSSVDSQIRNVPTGVQHSRTNYSGQTGFSHPPPSSGCQRFPPGFSHPSPSNHSSKRAPLPPPPPLSTFTSPSMANPPPFEVPPTGSGFPFLNDEGFFDVTSHSAQQSSCSREADEQISIRNWLQGLDRKRQPAIKSAAPDSVKIYEMKDKIQKIQGLIKDLEGQSKSLLVMMKSLEEEDWMSRVEEVETKKQTLISCLRDLTNNSDKMALVKKKLEKRSKKREREKRRREERKRDREEKRVAHAQIDARLNLWLSEMQEAVERTRRDEELKRDADSVLGEVTKKKAETKRQLALLEGLGRLYKARLTARESMGLAINKQQDATFSQVVERLNSMWESCLERYNLEEHGLKVMLNEAAAEEKSSTVKRQKLVLNQWETALFGDDVTNQGNIHIPKDLETFTSVRNDWDRFVVSEDSVMSSSIPIGWVLPAKPSSDEWKKLLRIEQRQ